MKELYPRLEFNEGVGDKYAEREFHFVNDKEHKFEKKFHKEENPSWVGEILYSYRGEKRKGKTNIFLNPQSLNSFDPMVRGIILTNGDLYLADNSRHVIHIDIVKFLIEEGIIKGPLEKEALENFMEEEYDYPKQFICIIRILKTNIITIGESSIKGLNNMKFMEEAKKKNPNLTFSNKDPYLLAKELTEQIVLVKEFLTDDQQMKYGYEQMQRDYKSYGLNKIVLGTMTDEGGEIVKVCGINGMFVRDKNPGLNFDQFVDGGHYYVDSYPGYKKNIPKDEIWVDDVFMMKPNDLKAIVLHEFVERNKMKYHKWSYSRAHEHANKLEIKYREKTKE